MPYSPDNIVDPNIPEDHSGIGQAPDTELSSVGILEKINVTALAQLLVLSGVAIFLPFFIHLPFLTGPIVNAVLILILFLTGRRNAILVSCLPSLMALIGGLLPLALAPAVPFIILSNIILVVIIDEFYKSWRDDFKGYWLGVLAGAVLKFVFLFFSVNILAAFFLKEPALKAVSQLFGWSQLVTALLGGLIAWGVLKFLKFFK